MRPLPAERDPGSSLPVQGLRGNVAVCEPARGLHWTPDLPRHPASRTDGATQLWYCVAADQTDGHRDRGDMSRFPQGRKLLERSLGEADHRWVERAG